MTSTHGADRQTPLADDVTIVLDKKTRAIRSGSRWAVQRLQPDGSWDMTAHWDGGRRTIYHWMEKNNVHPTREAEAALDALAEGIAFRER